MVVFSILFITSVSVIFDVASVRYVSCGSLLFEDSAFSLPGGTDSLAVIALCSGGYPLRIGLFSCQGAKNPGHIYNLLLYLSQL
nr:MAG TPA: hypothetical protein [Caudoviricetes sp.]